MVCLVWLSFGKISFEYVLYAHTYGKSGCSHGSGWNTLWHRLIWLSSARELSTAHFEIMASVWKSSLGRDGCVDYFKYAKKKEHLMTLSVIPFDHQKSFALERENKKQLSQQIMGARTPQVNCTSLDIFIRAGQSSQVPMLLIWQRNSLETTT